MTASHRHAQDVHRPYRLRLHGRFPPAKSARRCTSCALHQRSLSSTRAVDCPPHAHYRLAGALAPHPACYQGRGKRPPGVWHCCAIDASTRAQPVEVSPASVPLTVLPSLLYSGFASARKGSQRPSPISPSESGRPTVDRTPLRQAKFTDPKVSVVCL